MILHGALADRILQLLSPYGTFLKKINYFICLDVFVLYKLLPFRALVDDQIFDRGWSLLGLMGTLLRVVFSVRLSFAQQVTLMLMMMVALSSEEGVDKICFPPDPFEELPPPTALAVYQQSNMAVLDTGTQCLGRTFFNGAMSMPLLLAAVARDPHLLELLRLAGLGMEITYESIRDSVWRLFESKGHPFGSSNYAVRSGIDGDSQLSRELAERTYDQSFTRPDKALRNLVPGHLGYDFPIERALKDFFGGWVVFQQTLLHELQSGNSFSGVAYRFGPLNGQYAFSEPIISEHIASSSDGMTLFNPTYMSRAVQHGILTVYQIVSKEAGVPIYQVTDQSLRPDSRIGTGEVVFPAGTRYEPVTHKLYNLGRYGRVVKTDSFAPGKSNYLVESTLTRKGESPVKLLFLLKLGNMNWREGQNVDLNEFGRQDMPKIRIRRVEAYPPPL